MNHSMAELLALATELLAPWAERGLISRPEPDRMDVALATSDELLPAVTALRPSRLGYLSAITGLDLGPEAGELELLYHFCAGPLILTLRLRAPRDGGAVPTLTGLIPSAEPYERELSEMFGIDIAGLAAPAHLYLPEDWPLGVYPLRKDFDPAQLAGRAAEGETS